MLYSGVIETSAQLISKIEMGQIQLAVKIRAPVPSKEKVSSSMGF